MEKEYTVHTTYTVYSFSSSFSTQAPPYISAETLESSDARVHAGEAWPATISVHVPTSGSHREDGGVFRSISVPPSCRTRVINS
jgi:hypothetical protein